MESLISRGASRKKSSSGTSLDRLNVVAFLVHEVVKLQRREIHGCLGTLRFRFHAVFLEQDTAICLKTNEES
ncbi:hypothetical protein CR513_52653, partial [Mucuna pruriens]